MVIDGCCQLVGGAGVDLEVSVQAFRKPRDPAGWADHSHCGKARELIYPGPNKSTHEPFHNGSDLPSQQDLVAFEMPERSLRGRRRLRRRADNIRRSPWLIKETRASSHVCEENACCLMVTSQLQS